MRSTLLIALVAIVMSGCSVSMSANSSNDANSKNSNSASPSPSPSATKSETETGKDKPPTSMSISEFMSSSDRSNNGRIVTVTGGQLDKISYDSLLIRDGAGAAFYCYGSFSDYTDMSSKIDSMRQAGKSPGATVTGTFSLESDYGKPDLKSCILTDLKK